MTAKLEGRAAVVTGVSRREGIGFAVAKRFLQLGARVFVQSWRPHDAEMPWGKHAAPQDELIAELERLGEVAHASADFEEADAAKHIVARAAEAFGHIDILVANHARSVGASLEEVTAEELDRSFRVNARASVLLAREWAAQYDDETRRGRIILFTSGQHLGPMPEEIPYALSKGAIHQITRSLADHLAPRGVTVNAVNPGPTDTGWASETVAASVVERMPLGRWGTPEDAARLVSWLASDDASWITGQVIDSEGGFRRT